MRGIYGTPLRALPHTAARSATHCCTVALPHEHCHNVTHALPHCYTLPHTAAHCRTLPYTAAYCRTTGIKPHTAARTARHYSAHIATHCRSHCRTAAHCRTIQIILIHLNSYEFILVIIEFIFIIHINPCKSI
jgi:hypothetical protein